MSPYRPKPMPPERLRWSESGLWSCLFESRCGRFSIWRAFTGAEAVGYSLEDRRRRKPISCRSIFAAKRKAKAILADEWYGDRCAVKPRRRKVKQQEAR